MTPESDAGPIVFFDGVCGLCNASARFIARRDRVGRFRFAHLQSPAAAELLDTQVRADTRLDSVLLLDGGMLHAKSDAALSIARRLDGPWPALAAFRVLPRGLRDLAYGFVAQNRYRWFGRTETCQIPPPGLAERFIPDGRGPAPTTETLE